jgi:hypothetical protein
VPESYFNEVITINQVEYEWRSKLKHFRQKIDYPLVIYIDNEVLELSLYFINQTEEYTIFLEWYHRILYIFKNELRTYKVKRE